MAGNSSRRRGRSRELDLIAWMQDEDRGWTAFRIDGSGDVVAGKDGVTLLIQCKSTDGPYDHFGPADRRRLSEDAARAGWFAFLFWAPKGTSVARGRWVPEHEWPGSKLEAPYLLPDQEFPVAA